MALSYLQYDVFTNEPFTGNQLAVFTDARDLTLERMQRIARELNFSETTFILPKERDDTDIRMRIFTPFIEMPSAGHPTIGTTFALAGTGVIPPDRRRFVFGLNIGPTPVDLQWDGGVLQFAWMTQRPPEFGPTLDDRAAVALGLGLTADDLAPGLPVQGVSCGVPFLFVPLRDRAAVDRAVSEASALRRLTADLPEQPPVFLFALLPEGDSATVHSRMFAPDFGIVEDPATGIASGPLGCYLVQHGLVRGDAARQIVSHQGVAMGRPSRIHIAIEGRPDAITGVKVGGQAVLVARGELLV